METSNRCFPENKDPVVKGSYITDQYPNDSDVLGIHGSSIKGRHYYEYSESVFLDCF